MIVLIPFERITINTTLTQEQAKQILTDKVVLVGEPDQKPDTEGIFRGKVSESGFELTRMRAFSRRNSLHPMLWGKFVTIPEGTRIEVIFTLHPLFLVTVVVALGLFYVNTLPRVGSVNYGVFPLLFLYVLVMIAFNITLMPAIRQIREIFNPYTIR
jgi:hypothetical protein